MTDVVTEQDSAAQAPAADEGPKFSGPEAEVSFNMIKNLIVERNNKVGRINAVKGDRQTLMEQLRETSDSPSAVEARARRDQAQEALDEAILDLDAAVRPEVEAVIADSEGAAKNLEEEVKELDGKIKPATSFFKKMFGEDLAKYLPGLERLKGFSTRGSGSGGRRIRGYNATVTIDGKSTSFDNVASVAKYLDLETVDLQKAFFDAAGNPEALKDAPDVVEFSVTYTETFDDGSNEERTAVVRCERTTNEASADDSDSDSNDESAE